MADDYYATLGVSRTASAEEIQQAYRKLARKYHPYLNPDDAAAKKKFHDVQTAFDVLNDEKKRKLYDQYGSAYESVGGGPQGWPGGSGAGQGFPGGGFPGSGGAGHGFPEKSFGGGQGFDINLEDLLGRGGGGGGGFADLFKQFGSRKRQQAKPARGNNLKFELTVPFTTAVSGGEAQISIRRATGDMETLQVKIPIGIEDRKKIRLRGQGEPSPNGGPKGGLRITVQVAPQPYFRRTGKRLDVRVPVTLFEALHGAKIDMPTPQGTITLSIPPGTSSGRELRVKGHGVAPKKGTPGDLFAEILIVLPKSLDEADRKQLETLTDKYSDDPRSDLRW